MTGFNASGLITVRYPTTRTVMIANTYAMRRRSLS